MGIQAIRWRKVRHTSLLAVLLTGALALTGCGLQPATAFVPPVAPGSIQRIESLPDGATITVVSKNSTEQLILAKIAVLAAKAAGFEVKDLSNVPGSVPVRHLMLDGGADIVWDYTGTAWLTYLGHEEGVPGNTAQYEAVRDADLKNGLTWLTPAEMNNTYAFAVRSEALPDLDNISELSQLKDLPVKDRTFCVEAEFNSRPDGFKPMLEAYGLTLGVPEGVPTSNIQVLDLGSVYAATDRGTCNFGEVFTTDGRMVALDLTILEDDKNFFPAYNVAPVLRTEVLNEYPGLKGVFESVSLRLTNAEQQKLNFRVDVDGVEPSTVALDWMQGQGLITAP